MAAPRDRVLNALSGICRVFVLCLWALSKLLAWRTHGAKVFYIRMRIIFYILYLISCILYLVSYILYLISCILYLISCICILYLVSCILYLVSCILYLVSCILYLVSCILYLISYILYFIFGLSIRSPCSYGRKTLLLRLEDHGLLFFFLLTVQRYEKY